MTSSSAQLPSPGQPRSAFAASGIASSRTASSHAPRESRCVHSAEDCQRRRWLRRALHCHGAAQVVAAGEALVTVIDPRSYMSRIPTLGRKVAVVTDWTLAFVFRRDVTS